MSCPVDEHLAQSRTDATNEGRVVLALEAIADGIKLIVSLLDRRGSAEGLASGNQNSSATASWENEGGGLSGGSILPEGVERHVTETFTVGAYHYTNLVDALAQAGRAARDR